MTDELASHIYKTRKEVADVIQGAFKRSPPSVARARSCTAAYC